MNIIWGKWKGEGGLHRHISTENPPSNLKKVVSKASFCFGLNPGEVLGGILTKNLQYLGGKYWKFRGDGVLRVCTGSGLGLVHPVTPSSL